ncbi:hypothetical protein C8R45DRAFT_191399 [Mycena sanguinolenta]|nr:hypothetical protein C8R45DRAFT_191399 [Mycena sanguinolenta]
MSSILVRRVEARKSAISLGSSRKLDASLVVFTLPPSRSAASARFVRPETAIPSKMRVYKQWRKSKTRTMRRWQTEDPSMTRLFASLLSSLSLPSRLNSTTAMRRPPAAHSLLEAVRTHTTGPTSTPTTAIALSSEGVVDLELESRVPAVSPDEDSRSHRLGIVRLRLAGAHSLYTYTYVVSIRTRVVVRATGRKRTNAGVRGSLALARLSRSLVSPSRASSCEFTIAPCLPHVCVSFPRAPLRADTTSRHCSRGGSRPVASGKRKRGRPPSRRGIG